VNEHGALRWHSFGLYERQAWSTYDGQPAAHWFRIGPTRQGFRMDAQQVGTGAPALPVITMLFEHADWTIESIQALAERLRPALPKLGPECWLPLARIEAQIAERLQLPTRCYFRHVFPLGADDSAVCECQRITKGLYEATRTKEANSGTR
jgi:hypothetical protein